MHTRSLMVALAGLLMLTLQGAAPAQADWWPRCGYPGCDPYYYQPSPRGYYPYYNSGEWRPASELRYRYRRQYEFPPYYQAWGYPQADYDHKTWHRYNHGGHRRWDW